MHSAVCSAVYQLASLLPYRPGRTLCLLPVLLRPEGLRGEGEPAELGGDEGVLDQEHFQDVPGSGGQQGQLEGGGVCVLGGEGVI